MSYSNCFLTLLCRDFGPLLFMMFQFTQVCGHSFIHDFLRVWLQNFIEILYGSYHWPLNWYCHCPVTWKNFIQAVRQVTLTIKYFGKLRSLWLIRWLQVVWLHIIHFPPPCLIWYVLLLMLCITDIKVLGLFRCSFANNTCSVIHVRSAIGVNLLRHPHLKVQTKTAITSAL